MPGVRIAPSVRIFVCAIACVSAMWSLGVAPARAQDTAAVDVPADASAEQLFNDAMHYFRIGRFEYGQAFLQAYLDSSPQPLDVLVLSEEDPQAVRLLTDLLKHTDIGPAAEQTLDLIEQGWQLRRQDPSRIRDQITRLGEGPRARYHAEARLSESGQYAVPYLVDVLRDPAHSTLHPVVLDSLAQIGRDALPPLLAATSTDDAATLRMLADVLGRIGYPQALPYLKLMHEQSADAPQVRSEVERAIAAIGTNSLNMNPRSSSAELFLALGRAYYEYTPSLQADPRLDQANIWYWQNDGLLYVQVPHDIYNDVMAMRCCRRSLDINSDNEAAIALWLAANFRREHHLATGETDATRPDNFPPAEYFAHTAGPRYAQMVLMRGLEDNEPVVALGAIEALQATAGQANLLATTDGTDNLVEAMTFPSQPIRTQAALTLAWAIPDRPYAGSPNVVPILTEAVAQAGRRAAVVIDPDMTNRNRLAAALRNQDFEVDSFESLNSGRSRIEAILPRLELITIASDVRAPDLSSALGQIANDLPTGRLPVVVLTKGQDRAAVQELLTLYPDLTQVPATVDPADLMQVFIDASRRLGRVVLTDEQAHMTAIDATRALKHLAVHGREYHDMAQAQDVLIEALAGDDTELVLAAGDTLAQIPTGQAQAALAAMALDDAVSADVREAMYNNLAASARKLGNMLPEDVADQLVQAAIHEDDMQLRTSASQAAGAANLTADRVQKIITQHNR